MRARSGRARGAGLRHERAAGASGTGVGCWARRACGKRGAATRGARAEACKARVERSGRAGAGVGARSAGRERAGRAAWAPGARGLGVPVRIVGMLAGSAGPVWVLVNLAQFLLSF